MPKPHSYTPPLILGPNPDPITYLDPMPRTPNHQLQPPAPTPSLTARPAPTNIPKPSPYPDPNTRSSSPARAEFPSEFPPFARLRRRRCRRRPARRRRRRPARRRVSALGRRALSLSELIRASSEARSERADCTAASV